MIVCVIARIPTQDQRKVKNKKVEEVIDCVIECAKAHFYGILHKKSLNHAGYSHHNRSNPVYTRLSAITIFLFFYFYTY